MTTLPIITAFYAALIGLLAAALAGNVIRNRVVQKVDDGDGGRAEMRMPIRAHANLMEYAPLVLLLMAFAESAGASKIAIYVLGTVLVVARLLSAWGLLHSVGPSFGRQAGASLTILTLFAASVLVLLRVAGVV